MIPPYHIFFHIGFVVHWIIDAYCYAYTTNYVSSNYCHVLLFTIISYIICSLDWFKGKLKQETTIDHWNILKVPLRFFPGTGPFQRCVLKNGGCFWNSSILMGYNNNNNDNNNRDTRGYCNQFISFGGFRFVVAFFYHPSHGTCLVSMGDTPKWLVYR